MDFFSLVSTPVKSRWTIPLRERPATISTRGSLWNLGPTDLLILAKTFSFNTSKETKKFSLLKKAKFSWKTVPLGNIPGAIVRTNLILVAEELSEAFIYFYTELYREHSSNVPAKKNCISQTKSHLLGEGGGGTRPSDWENWTQNSQKEKSKTQCITRT